MTGEPAEPFALDLVRMRAERMAKLRAEMADKGVDAVVALTTGGVLYATGAPTPAADTGRTFARRAVAVVLADDPVPHLFTPYPQSVPDDLPADHLHPAFQPETAEGARAMAATVVERLGGARGRVAVDDYTMPMWAAFPVVLSGVELVDAGPLFTAVRLHKTPDEVECLRRSWRMNEEATRAVEALVRPGVRTSELSGAYLSELFQRGATTNFLDPVFQPMPERVADGPWSTNGDIPFNLGTTDHVLSEGEVIWTDTVSGYEGYASDVGRTWVVGPVSAVRQQLHERWEAITAAVLAEIRPGVTADVLTRVATDANGGSKPWLDHFFLGHTLGLEGGEMQHIGSDKGQAYD
ncbi:MAG TPA: M24 family metallopeptidase, partial [Nocardioides sp.]|nr:M24 family metallopeptidase [Nocardioides sp.]